MYGWQLPWFLNCFAMQLSKFHTSMIDSFLDTLVESCLSCTKHRIVRLMTTKMSPVAVTYWRKDTHSEALQNVFLLTWPVDDIFVITLLCLDSLSSYGCWAVAVASPTALNSLSDDLRDPTLSTVSFRCLLKTRLLPEYTSTHSALEVSHFMRYINSRHTYILTDTYWTSVLCY